MPYTIQVTPRAEKELSGIRGKQRVKIDKAIDRLADDPRPQQSKALKGKLAGQYRIRVNDFRVLYLVEDGELLVLVVRVLNRKKSYR